LLTQLQLTVELVMLLKSN